MPEEEIGKVTRFFNKIGVAGIMIEKGNLKVGDLIHVSGATTDVTSPIGTIQIQGKDVVQAGPGDEIGIRMADKVRPNDKVFKVS